MKTKTKSKEDYFEKRRKELIKKIGRPKWKSFEHFVQMGGIWKDRTDIDPLTVRQEAWGRK